MRYATITSPQNIWDIENTPKYEKKGGHFNSEVNLHLSLGIACGDGKLVNNLPI